MADRSLVESSSSSSSKKTVLITGVSKGLGRALALELASRGHFIIGCSRDQTKLDSLRLQLSDLSPSSSPNNLLLNINRSNTSLQEVAQTLAENKLLPDIIVNNAAVLNKKGNLWEIDEEDFDSVIDTNVKGVANVLRHFIPLMIPNNQGIIVNISSDAGRNPYQWIAPYCASKWAIEGLSKCIAKELPEGMTIVSLDPGPINTDMLASFMGDLASDYPSPQLWASIAATRILDITAKDNGASLTIENLATSVNVE